MKQKPQDKPTNAAFILMFPAFIVAVIAAAYAPIYLSLVVIALAIYQFLMTKKFVEDYYKGRE